MQALPFDITDIPVFAWSPSLRTWFLLAALTGFLAASIILFYRSKRGRSAMSPPEAALRDLEGLSSAQHLSPSQKVSLAHLTVKKALGFLAGFETSHLTVTELEDSFRDSKRFLLEDGKAEVIMGFLKDSAGYMYGRRSDNPDSFLSGAREALRAISRSWDILHGEDKKNA